MQVVPASGQNNLSLEVNTFSKIFNYNTKPTDPLFSGTNFTFLSVADEFNYEINFQNGVAHSLAVIRYKKAGGISGKGSTEGCYSTYMLWYFDDGSTALEFLYEDCNVCQETRTISGKQEIVACGGGSGEEYEILVMKSMNWEVYREHCANSDAIIKASIFLVGRRNSNDPQGGHFTDMREPDSYTLNFSDYGMTHGAYHSYWYSAQIAHDNVAGTVYYNLPNIPDQPYSHNKSWDFAVAFP